LKNLQSLYKRAGKLMEFIPLTIRLVEIRSKESGEESAQVATELNELGVAYYHINNLEEAVNRYKEALKIRQKLFGAQSL
jgi:tetratricopeptide (TPR) repeat protein